jgi:putative acetyltransferase
MKIRRFARGDEQALFRVFLTAVHVVAAKDYSPEQIAAWEPADFDATVWALRVQRTRPFVAELDEEIVGFADLQPTGYIDQFFVSGLYPRRGIGSMLMAHIHQEAEALGLNELTSDVSKTAEPFFLRHGFHVLERRFPVRHGVVLENALMRKVL